MARARASLIFQGPLWDNFFQMEIVILIQHQWKMSIKYDLNFFKSKTTSIFLWIKDDLKENKTQPKTIK